jgi:hypothetical protein
MPSRSVLAASMCASRRAGFGIAAQTFVLLETPH